MKITLFFALLLLILTACGRNNDTTGGRLPMLVTDWTGIIDGDVLMQFDYTSLIGKNISVGEVLAVIGDDQPVPRRIAVQMLESIGHLGFGEFEENEMLTLAQAQEIMRRLHPEGNDIYLTEENRNAYISYALWVELYMQLLDKQGNSHGVEAINIIPLGMVDGQVLTNRGTFGGKSINLGAFLDREIRILHRNREIFAVLGVTDFTPTLKNAMVTHSDMFGITVYIGGAMRNYVYRAGVAPLSAGVGDTTVIVNVQIHGQEIVIITPAEAVITGTIERVRPHAIDLKEWGAVPLCPYFAVYTLETGSGEARDLLVGTEIADFHVINGRIGAAVITQSIAPTNIRVAIHTSGFAGLVHEQVTITATGPFTVRGSGRTGQFAAGHHFTVGPAENADLWGNIRLYISPDDPVNHRLEIVGLGRNWANGQSPQYRGVFEIVRNNGLGAGFVIVNELCIEEYLYAVIPSEMPTSHGLEAAKVQAITARSFALHQIYQNAFRAFGAHVDDSVISQVYNNIPETEISKAAVAATRGQILTVDGQLVIANYFSTSGGTTANFGEVWAQGSQFPGDTPVHLQSMPQFYVQAHSPGNLREERYAAAFFRSLDIPGFDREFAWFRWHTRLTVAELSSSINVNIGARQAANPAMIQVLDANGEPTGAVIRSIGQLIDLEVVQRGQGGNIMEMILTGTEATVRVRTEFNIRTLLNPGSVPVLRHNGTQVSNLSLLPSAFFTMEKETDTNGRIIAVNFFGGGNGHGVGMSQNGVKALVDKGMTYRDILRHYYPGAEVAALLR